MRVTFKHPVYLSEKEICDQVQDNYDEFFNHMGDSIVFREVSLGACRADFIEFTKEYINIVEVKISANIDSVRQVIMYKRVAEEHMRLNFDKHSLDLKFNFCATIMARNIDRDIMDICEEMNICVYRLKFDKNKILVGAEMVNEFFPLVIESPEFIGLLKEHAGHKNV